MGILAGDPAADRPGKRIALARRGCGERDGNGERQMRRQARQPELLLAEERRRGRVTRQAQTEVRAQAEDGVVGTARCDPLQGQVAPERKPAVDEPAGQSRADLDLVGMEARWAHRVRSVPPGSVAALAVGLTRVGWRRRGGPGTASRRRRRAGTGMTPFRWAQGPSPGPAHSPSTRA